MSHLLDLVQVKTDAVAMAVADHSHHVAATRVMSGASTQEPPAAFATPGISGTPNPDCVRWKFPQF